MIAYKIFRLDEIMHMFSITKPSVIFCDSNKIEILQSAINEIQLNALIYVLGDGVDGIESVLNIFQKETGIEKQFM